MIISRTPLRMSFAGGGSDLREYYTNKPGSVLSTTINKYLYVSVNARFIDSIGIKYSQVEESENVNDIKHRLVREALKLVGINKGVEIVYTSDLLPSHHGSGLGSSSSLIVGTLNALHVFKGEHLSADQLAREASKIEIEILGKPIGKQDQYAVAYGGFNHLIFNQDESVSVNQINLLSETKKELRKKLLLFYTGINKDSKQILKEQKLKTQTNLNILHSMVDLSHELSNKLKLQDISNFGEILHKGWTFKQKLASEITNDFINNYYVSALKAGATGGKILGSGGGGFLLLYCEPEYQGQVRRALSNLKELPFDFESQGSKIIYIGS